MNWIKRVNEICSDNTGADKPYKEHCEKWGKVLAEDFQKMMDELADDFLKDYGYYLHTIGVDELAIAYYIKNWKPQGE